MHARTYISLNAYGARGCASQPCWLRNLVLFLYREQLTNERAELSLFFLNSLTLFPFLFLYLFTHSRTLSLSLYLSLSLIHRRLFRLIPNIMLRLPRVDDKFEFEIEMI